MCVWIERCIYGGRIYIYIYTYGYMIYTYLYTYIPTSIYISVYIYRIYICDRLYIAIQESIHSDLVTTKKQKYSTTRSISVRVSTELVLSSKLE